MGYIKVQFPNGRGQMLSGKLDLPLNKYIDGYAIFAHVFTGHKNLIASKYISRALTMQNIAVLRFDFTGLGESTGDFSDTNFSTNIEDIIAAADFLAKNYQAPEIIVGQSLGGAASIFAADRIASVKAIATIGAPSEPEHVMHLLGCHKEDIVKNGSAEVSIGGQKYVIKRHFVEDVQLKKMATKIKDLRKAIMIMHSPQDEIVEIENAAKIYHAAFHPKSFVTLDGTDHMLSNKEDAFYAGAVIASWVKRYIQLPSRGDLQTNHQVIAQLDGSKFTTEIKAGKHVLVADEPKSLGGNDYGPTPYDLLNAALSACTAMTLKMYAQRKKWDLQEVKVHISFSRTHEKDMEDTTRTGRRLEQFEKVLELKGDLDDSQKQRLVEIANRCPVHRTLEGSPDFITTLK
ncbi:MAG: OsmC family protein [Saprospiraceae bacterium]|nr:OsmC family protein [Saprospiraceae bacterium]